MIAIDFLLLFLLIAPFSLLFHEIGHAVGAKIFQASSIQLSLGVGNKLWAARWQNIHITIYTFFLVNSYVASIREERFSKKEKIIIALLGPMFSLLLATLLFIVYHAFISANVVYIFFLFNVWIFFINLIPIKIGQKQSDGYTICKLMLKRNYDK
ncbi:M50 family metallopeptidase [Pseudogracilibacillus sp. SE30717A]|uniref:M50 family metallopeptidase n=1 Tax=Pseudogracilibacillus sp. SE30717A TaxID=3098293 RepID=UPI00300E12B6